MFGPKKTLDTPFGRGETVQLTETVMGVPEGTEGKVRLSNGLGVWLSLIHI